MSPQLSKMLKDFSTASYTPSREQYDASWGPALSALLGLGRVAGATFVEFFLDRRNFVQCAVENGRVASVSPSLSVGAGVRVFRGEADCYVSTNDVTFAGLHWALERALGILGLSWGNSQAFVPEINLEPLRDYAQSKHKTKWLAACPTIADTTGILLNFNELLTKKTNHVQNTITSSFRDWQEVLVASSDGIFARDIRLTQRIGGEVTCVDGDHRASLGERDGSSANPEFLAAANLQNMTLQISESAGKMLYADYVKAGQYPIVMANRFGGVIFHEACGHLLETTQIERKTTPFVEMMGKPIAHESVTAWDEGLTPNAFGTLDMDDEGMPTQRTLLIENGILKNFIADRTGSLKTGHARTGSGRRQNSAFAAASRMRNTYISGGPHTPQDLISSVEHGLYCKRMGGGSVGATGEFNFAVAEGYLIEKGKLTKPVKGATLIGEAKHVMNEISMCANDLELASGFCGSVSGSIYVTVGQPHIKVNSITVGGR